MSHFTVLVIGSNPEEQLEPYDENLAVEAYIGGEVNDDDKQRFVNYCLQKHPEGEQLVSEEDPYGEENWNENMEIDFEEYYDKYGKEWNDNTWEKDENGVWQEYTTYNPDSKWDWYQIGGRWTGFFKIKKGKKGKLGDKSFMSSSKPEKGTADQALKGDVDFEAMEEGSRKKAAERYDEAMKLFGHLPKNLSWNEVLKMDDIDINQKRNFYWAQERCIAARNKYFMGPDEFLCSKEEYVNEAGESSFSTYAYVYKGKWYGKGEMGWFGMSSGDKPEEDWNKEFRKLLDSLPDNTLLTLFDCHI